MTRVRSMRRQRAKLWTCPNCGRKFAKGNQAHSCLAHTVDHHFRGKDPQLRQTYERLIARLREFGPVRVDAVKSSINLVSKYHFGGIAVRRNYIRLGFLADETIEHERIIRTRRQGPKRVSHWLRLRSPSDVDGRLVTWLKKAYILQAAPDLTEVHHVS